MKRLLTLLTGCLLVGAAQAQEVRRALPVDAPAPVPVPVAVPDSNADDLAKFLGGRPSPNLAQFQDNPTYRSYVAEMAKLSRHYNENYFSPMRQWSQSQLAPLLPPGRPVYYFFGGPDALSAVAYFPDAPVYILGGLEPVGSIPSPQTLPPEAIDQGLANLKKSTEVILSYGHFITKDMKAELEATAFKGVLPIISAFLSFSGADVLSVSYIGISSDGSQVDLGNAYADAKGRLPGLKIVFRRYDTGVPQTLYYIQANVVDDALKANGGLLKWASSFGTGHVYFKAASHLLHEPYFSRIREFLLKQADAVLQDDSGIPYHFFVERGWRCYLFGTYTGTLEIFAKYQQPDLLAAYASGATPLPFGTGYKWRRGESNLLLAFPPRKAEPL